MRVPEIKSGGGFFPVFVEAGSLSGSAHEAVNARIVVRHTTIIARPRIDIEIFMGYAPWNESIALFTRFSGRVQGLGDALGHTRMQMPQTAPRPMC